MTYLQGLRLANPVTRSGNFEISLLIGADYYWQFVGDHIVCGEGPTALQSKLGYLLSGSLATPISPSVHKFMPICYTLPQQPPRVTQPLSSGV